MTSLVLVVLYVALTTYQDIMYFSSSSVTLKSSF